MVLLLILLFYFVNACYKYHRLLLPGAPLNRKCYQEEKGCLEEQIFFWDNYEEIKGCPDGIDAVWIWEDNFDPFYLEDYYRFTKSEKIKKFTDTLKYSMRSVYKYATYIRNYYIVTKSQTPPFLTSREIRVDDMTLIVVDQREIFPDVKSVPSFNANAIDSAIHRIKGLHNCYVYMNDYMMLSRDLKPRKHMNDKGKSLLYYSIDFTPDPRSKGIWHECVKRTNEMLNVYFKKPIDSKRYYSSFTYHFFRRDIMYEIEKAFEPEFDITRRNRFRSANDIQIPFLFNNYAAESGLGISNDPYDNLITWDSLPVNLNKTQFIIASDSIKRYRGDCFAIQDLIRSRKLTVPVEEMLALLEDFLDSRYPIPTPFEIIG